MPMTSDVLIVDDEPMLRANLVRALERVGIGAQGAATRGDALEALVSRKFALVCVDVHLGQEDGFEFVNFVRGYQPRIPVVVMTGNDTPVNRDRAGDLGATFLPKPFSLGCFRDLVSSFLPAAAAAVVHGSHQGGLRPPCRNPARLIAALCETRSTRGKCPRGSS